MGQSPRRAGDAHWLPFAAPIARRGFSAASQRTFKLQEIVTLLVFGSVKGRFTTARPLRSAVQTVIVGGLAASAAFLIAKAIG